MRVLPFAISIGLTIGLTGCFAGGNAPEKLERRDAGGSEDARILLDANTPPATCLETDLDHDGFGTSELCAVQDCDDNNISIFPGGLEACNGLDDDCDGQRDEDLGESTCGSGPCARVVPYCLNGRPQACTPGQGLPETCNGVDDNCNGERDEGVGGGETCGTGACARTAQCVNGSFEQCVPGPQGTEECNRVDDDCDGNVDNGFFANTVNGSYTALSAHQSDCDGNIQRIGVECNAAIHRYCGTIGCTTSGFGPTENVGDVANIVCVVVSALIDVPYSTLAVSHGPCDGTNERIGPNCNAAIHRHCASLGFASGFGPLEQGASTALVACLNGPQASVINTQYSVLVTFHDGCSEGGERIGGSCNAAISRFCAANGFNSGYGPVENAGDGATVTCVSP